MRAITFVLVVASVSLTLAQGRGGGPPLAIPRTTFGDGPWTVEAAEGVKIRMSVVTKGLVNPWSFAITTSSRHARSSCAASLNTSGPTNPATSLTIIQRHRVCCRMWRATP